jgi:hypothetical protein
MSLRAGGAPANPSDDLGAAYQGAALAVRSCDWLFQLAVDGARLDALHFPVRDLGWALGTLKEARTAGAFLIAERTNPQPASACGFTKPTWIEVSYCVTGQVGLVLCCAHGNWSEAAERLRAFEYLRVHPRTDWPTMPRELLLAELAIERGCALARLAVPACSRAGVRDRSRNRGTARTQRRCGPEASRALRERASRCRSRAQRPRVARSSIPLPYPESDAGQAGHGRLHSRRGWGWAMTRDEWGPRPPREFLDEEAAVETRVAEREQRLRDLKMAVVGEEAAE